ncbi:hypothetical protein DL95DRAFT_470381 [Leptodontidium sp. 2 PMI_412]|nr:hypothetical protein DL95DRAFT_470381 [Leptodontidium sp. 2 PMI_412]
MKMNTNITNADAQELRSNHPVSSVEVANVNTVTLLSPPSSAETPSTAEKPPSSSIDRILQEAESILHHKSYHSSFEPKTHTLSKCEYQELLERVQGESFELQEFWHNKLRYDCCLRTSSFVIKMPGIIHEVVKDTVRDSVDEQLKAAKCDIKSTGGASDLRFEGSSFANRQPDIGFRHQNPPHQNEMDPVERYPGLIIEVAHSQSSDSLRQVAYDYILGSKGDIKTVVGIDIGYTKPEDKDSSKLATMSIWKAKKRSGSDVDVQKVLDAKPFRNAEGSYVQFDDVSLTYDDFTIYPQPPIPEEQFSVSISSKVLFDCLTKGERRLAAEANYTSSNILQKQPIKSAIVPPKRSCAEDSGNSSEEAGDVNEDLDKSYYRGNRRRHDDESNSTRGL